MATGITKRHARGCRSCEGGRCNCEPTYQAWVWSERDRKKIYKAFAREAEAKTWRSDALSALSKGALRAPAPTTVREAWEAWYAGALAGVIRNRSGDPYKPSALRAYEYAMRLRVLPELGAWRLADVRGPDAQAFVDELLAEGLNPSTISSTVIPLRAIFRRAVRRGELAVNPCADLELPAVRSRRERFASAEEARALIAALEPGDRAIWATAMYAGLRCGELQALEAKSVDLAAGVIRVEWGWDAKEGRIALKSSAGKRKVPIAAVLRDHLDHPDRSDGLIFGEDGETPFAPRDLGRRADASWEAAGLERITLHECRHTCASLMIAAGVNAKALQTFMGHANIAVTYDLYGHLMPGSEAEAAQLLDSYLEAQHERALEAARAAGGVLTGAHTGAQDT